MTTKRITDNAEFAAANRHLAELCAAEAAAVLDEASIASALNEPAERETALSAAARLLRGEPLTRVDADGQALALQEVRQRLALLRAAIVEQDSVIAKCKSRLSAEASAAAEPGHIKSVQGVVAALDALRDAMAAEVKVRDDLHSAGYRCSLPAVAWPDLNFGDSQSAASRARAEAALHLNVHRVRTGPAVTVRLLVDHEGVGQVGDLVQVDGHIAAGLVAACRAEVTTAKPMRAARSGAAAAEVVLS